jgi:tetratricopeptide (TPR) repeat protein
MPKPPDVTAYLAEALTLHQAGRLADAEKIYKQILAREPGHAESLNWLGVIAHQRAHHAEAIRLIDLALKTNPGDVLALNNRGNALLALKRFEEALSSYDRALAVRPDFAVAHYNRGNTLHALARLDEALASYDRALALQPNYPEAHGNRGIVLHNLKRFDEALSSYQRALAMRPDFAEAHYCEALSRLLTGDLDRGWQKHEWRWHTQQLGHGRRNFVQPLWDGADDIAGKTILLHAEQGFGDTIQFCRYVPRVAERGARDPGSAKAAFRADGHFLWRSRHRATWRPAGRFRYALPAAQLAARVPGASRDDTLRDAVFARALAGRCGLERTASVTHAPENWTRLVRSPDPQQRSQSIY